MRALPPYDDSDWLAQSVRLWDFKLKNLRTATRTRFLRKRQNAKYIAGMNMGNYARQQVSRHIL